MMELQKELAHLTAWLESHGDASPLLRADVRVVAEHVKLIMRGGGNRIRAIMAVDQASYDFAHLTEIQQGD